MTINCNGHTEPIEKSIRLKEFTKFIFFKYLLIDLELWIKNSKNLGNDVFTLNQLNHIVALDMSLTLARQDVFQPANGGRPDANQVLIILTDGVENAGSKQPEAINLAFDIRSQGVTILVIGVGDKVKPATLDEMGGGQNTPAPASLAKTPDELKTRKFIHQMVQRSGELGLYS